MKNYVVILLLVFSFSGYAQNYDADSVLYTPLEKPNAKKVKLIDEEKNSKNVAYFFNIQMGALIGCNDCGKEKDVTYSFATTHGVTIGKKFRAGLGAGFDSYVNWQTIPVFAAASWDLIGNKNKNAIFLQVAYGWAHPWFVRNGTSNYYYATDPFSSVSGGRMINPSIGYRLKYHDLKVSVGVGYKYQQIFYKTNTYYCGPACDYQLPNQNVEITQDYNRVQVMMSVGWK